MTEEYFKTLKASMHIAFDTPQGKEIMSYLEKTCCWYQTELSGDRDATLVNVGKRQVLASIKTILELSPEQLLALYEKEN